MYKIVFYYRNGKTATVRNICGARIGSVALPYDEASVITLMRKGSSPFVYTSQFLAQLEAIEVFSLTPCSKKSGNRSYTAMKLDEAAHYTVITTLRGFLRRYVGMDLKQCPETGCLDTFVYNPNMYATVINDTSKSFKVF